MISSFSKKKIIFLKIADLKLLSIITEPDGSFIPWFTFSIPVTTGTRPDCSPELRTPSRFPVLVLRAQFLSHHLLTCQGTQAQYGGECGGPKRYLNHYAMCLPPLKLFSKSVINFRFLYLCVCILCSFLFNMHS